LEVSERIGLVGIGSAFSHKISSLSGVLVVLALRDKCLQLVLFEIITDVLEILCGRGAGVMVAVCGSFVLTLNSLNDTSQCKY